LARIFKEMVYRTDYHVHSSYSDGRSLPEEYIDYALTAGLSEIGFSDHLSVNHNLADNNMNPANISSYINHILKIQKETRNIKIRIGLEVDFFEGKEKEIGDFLRLQPLDYVIGSVHYIGKKSVDLGTEIYETENINKLFESYFDSVCAAISSGLFDIIGHCDLIRIYGYRPSIDQEPFYRKLAKTMKAHDVVFEINTNGRNRPLADFYPNRKYLHIFREEDVPLCVNSDAHMPSRVGQHFDEVYELLRYIGYTEMAIFEKRIRYMVPF